MSEVRPGILAPLPALGRYLSFSAEPQGDPRAALRALGELADGQRLAVGLGESLLPALGREIAGLHSFAGAVGPGLELPATPAARWCWLRDDDRGDLVHLTRKLQVALGGALDGGSFVAVQQWLHDFGRFEAMSPREQDHAIGRRRSDNAELNDAPARAHVKRTAQESFEPEAFMLRRSMPWSEGQRAGLVFVAFGRSLGAFEVQLQHMVGAEDGITGALFRFTRPITGAYFWCPPLRNGRLDLRALDL